MKVFTLYYDRYLEATTSKALYNADIKHTVLCHANKEKFHNIFGDIVETGAPKGIQHNFNAGLNLLAENDWGVFLSDDYKHSRCLSSDGLKFESCNLKFLFDQLRFLLPKAERAGVYLVGFNSNGNARFASNKYGKYGLVDGRFLAIRKTAFKFHENIDTIPDYYATAYHLKKYGGNLIINYCYADFIRYGSKGLGTIKDRLDAKLHDVKLMQKLYPDMVVVKSKPGEPKGSHIIIKRV